MNQCFLAVLAMVFLSCTPKKSQPSIQEVVPSTDGWISLYNGKDLRDWKISEHDESFKVEDGILVAQGERAHLFYNGAALGEGFDHFELEAEVRTSPGANSGIFFHTSFQESGWPEQGFEVQVNQSHKGGGDYYEFKKSGSLYGTRNTYFANVKDGEWYKTTMIVNGDRVRIYINDVLTVDYYQFYDDENSKKLSRGTFAIQCHDPASRVEFKSIKVKRLPLEPSAIRMRPLGPWHKRMLKIQKEQNMAFLDLNPDLGEEDSIDERMENGFVTGINVGFIWDEQIGEELNLSYIDRSIVLGKHYGSEVEYKNISYTIAPATLVNLPDAIKKGEVQIITFNDKADEALILPLLGEISKMGLAIQIDNVLKLPSMDFIKKASAAGCKFSFRGISSFDLPGNSEYFLDAIEEGKIAYKQIYVPERVVE